MTLFIRSKKYVPRNNFVIFENILYFSREIVDVPGKYLNHTPINTLIFQGNEALQFVTISK